MHPLKFLWTPVYVTCLLEASLALLTVSSLYHVCCLESERPYNSPHHHLSPAKLLSTLVPLLVRCHGQPDSHTGRELQLRNCLGLVSLWVCVRGPVFIII